MPNYQNGKIYKLVCNTTGNIYIGSTTLELCQRKAKHTNNYKSFIKGKKHSHYVTSFEVIKGGNFSIVLLELFPCLDRTQLQEREGHYIKTIECVNKLVMGRTFEEYNIRVKCECGCHITKCRLSNHVKSQTHKSFILNNPPQTDNKYNYTVSDQPIIRLQKPIKPKIKLVRKTIK